MAEAGLLFLGALCAWIGMGFLALSLDVHWRQVTEAPAGLNHKVLRSAGAAALAVSLMLCLLADHASMAALVWIMLLAASAFAVGLMLAWFPISLRPLTLMVTRKTSVTTGKTSVATGKASVATDKASVATDNITLN